MLCPITLSPVYATTHLCATASGVYNVPMSTPKGPRFKNRSVFYTNKTLQAFFKKAAVKRFGDVRNAEGRLFRALQLKAEDIITNLDLSEDEVKKIY